MAEAKKKPDLSDYVEVHTRIAKFYEKYPEGSLQSSYTFEDIGGPCIVVEARAYRTADDPRPGVGLASEPIPGKTPYTKDSEVMNGETSAWGRALAALGFEIKQGIASGNEIRARSGGDTGPATDKQRKYVNTLFGKANVPTEERKLIVEAVCGSDTLTAAGASTIIGKLKDGELEDLRKQAGLKPLSEQEDLTPDTDGLPE